MVGIGFDDGCVMIRLGKEDPTFSMDEGGKIVWIKHSEMQMINLKQLAIEDIKDGERLNLSVKGGELFFFWLPRELWIKLSQHADSHVLKGLCNIFSNFF